MNGTIKCWPTDKLVEWGLNPNCLTAEYLQGIGVNKSFPTRFARSVTKSDGCWTWMWRCKNPKKYGSISKGRRGEGILGAHVASWILHYGPIGVGLEICHTCDNPICVRPDHLRQWTRKQNMEDCKAKGRFKAGFPPGERHWHSKITDEMAKEVIRLHKSGLRATAIGEKLGITRSHAYLIYSGRSWTHLTKINSR